MSEEQINVYTCPACRGFTVTIDIDKGVTPMFLGCRASGNEDDCEGMAQSAMYPKRPRPPHIPAPAWEWYKASEEEIEAMPEGHRQYYRDGGLAIRKREQEKTT